MGQVYRDVRRAAGAACLTSIVAAGFALTGLMAGCAPERTDSGPAGRNAETGPGATGPPPRAIKPKEFQLVPLSDALLANAKLWKTLRAKCQIEIRSPVIKTTDNYVVFEDAEIMVFKRPGRKFEDVAVPGSRAVPSGPGTTAPLTIGRLVVPPVVMMRIDMGEEFILIGDGQEYAVNIPSLRQSFRGNYGEWPLGAKIPLRPEDIGAALEPATALFGMHQVLKQEGRLLEMMSFAWEEHPTPRLRLVNNVLLDRQTEKPVYIFKYTRQGFPHVDIKLLTFEDFPGASPVHSGATGTGSGVDSEGSLAPPVELATRIWIGYLFQRASVLIKLSDIRLNEPVLTPEYFQLPRVE